MLEPVTPVELDKLLTGDTPVAVCFSATWCGACRQTTPTLETASERFGKGEVLFAVLDVDAPGGREACRRYQVRNLPTVIVFRDQSIAGRRVGVQSLMQLTNWINVHLLAHGEATALPEE